jgi:hypothetical protein
MRVLPLGHFVLDLVSTTSTAIRLAETGYQTRVENGELLENHQGT